MDGVPGINLKGGICLSGGVGQRQTRSDKKVDVKATMSAILKNQLYEFAELCNEPVKDIAERLCLRGLVSPCIITVICKWLRYNYRYSRTLALGDIERPRLQLTPAGDTSRVSLRFNANDYDQLCSLARALDITPSSTATTLIRVTTSNSEFMYDFVEGLSKVNDMQRKEVKQFLSKVWGIEFKGGIK